MQSRSRLPVLVTSPDPTDGIQTELPGIRQVCGDALTGARQTGFSPVARVKAALDTSYLKVSGVALPTECNSGHFCPALEKKP